MSLNIFLLASALLVGIVHGCGCGCGSGTGTGTGTGTGSGNQGTNWYDQGIVPNVISYVPSNATIRFGTGAVIETNEYLSIYQVSSQLTSVDFEFISEGLYTIVVLDLDYPSVQHPTEAQHVQWLIMNIFGYSLTRGNLGSGNVVLPYEGPSPQPNTGTHRYLVLFFLQDSQLDITLNSRDHFDIATFADQYKLGQAVCGNYFLIST